MTKEDYQIKIKELRKQRDFHMKEAHKFEEEMNTLQIDEKFNDIMVGEYMLRDYSPSGYKIYFHVDSWEKTNRGAMMRGKGFYLADYGIQFKNSEPIIYEDTHDSCKTSIITKEEYEKAFEDAVEELKKKFYKIESK